MFRIRRVFDCTGPLNRETVKQVQEIIRTQFPSIPEKEVNSLPAKLHNPMKYRFRSFLFIADDEKRQVKGFALLSHEPALNFCFLDYISTAEDMNGRGIGGALYTRVREEALLLKTKGIFFECLPDNPKISRDPVIRKQNASRLRFYERFGAYPVINTAYETPLKPDDDNPPYLVYDRLNQDTELDLDSARAIVRTILERKYEKICPQDYIEMIVESFQDDPVRLRKPKYIKESPAIAIKKSIPADIRIALLINTKHSIHHVQEIGYVEAPVRIDSILNEIDKTDMFLKYKANHFGEKRIRAVHNSQFVNYFKRACASIEPGKSIYPYVFPIRNATHPPKELAIKAGYYCIDTFTPINNNAYLAAKGAVDCALTAAGKILEGTHLAYALVRPPGHHAEKRSFGGFCYFNSAAIAAQYLSAYGKVAMLDIDYHHGNGQQDIFYKRADVLTVSIHGHPSFAYPYFSGFATEKGAGNGEGYNINFPQPEKLDGEGYRRILKRAINKISRFKPDFLVVPLGLDTAEGDPTGSWSLHEQDFEENGKMIGALRLPTLVVQEGGYDTRLLGINAQHFFTGLWVGTYLT
jgi:acetoin utilization deacetylase AcuC-like enzyme/GNAT superfamily N-acetyltransferase